jgi:hypothetical protein
VPNGEAGKCGRQTLLEVAEIPKFRMSRCSKVLDRGPVFLFPPIVDRDAARYAIISRREMQATAAAAIWPIIEVRRRDFLFSHLSSRLCCRAVPIVIFLI